MKIRLLAVLACLAALAVTVTACGDDEDQSTAATMTTEQPAAAGDIVSVAQETPDLSTLVRAVTAADLAETLQGEGPYTVFAPTNAAFRALGDDLDALLQPARKSDLADVLTYHVVKGDVKAADLEDGQMVKTVQGGELEVSVDGDQVKIDDATVVKADVPADNGTVHVIDGVLTP